MTSEFHPLSLVPDQSGKAAASAATPSFEAFNLTQAIQGAPLCTRAGLPAQLMRVDETAPPEFRLKVKLPQYSYPRTYCDNGRYRSDGVDDEFDLFIVAEQSNTGVQQAVGIAA